MMQLDCSKNIFHQAILDIKFHVNFSAHTYLLQNIEIQYFNKKREHETLIDKSNTNSL